MNPTDLSPLEVALYVVATPIGNLGDLSARARDVLNNVSLVAAEDTRSFAQLLGHLGIRQPQTISAHAHNERTSADRLISALAEGRPCGLVSDAGTPAVSDPGARLVAKVREAGYRVIPIPGPSAIVTLLSAAGIDVDRFGEGADRFFFQGFLPSRPKARERTLSQLAGVSAAIIVLEAPHRIRASLAAIAEHLGADRQLVIGRELTKRFEQIVALAAADATAWLDADANHQRGEFVIAIAPPARADRESRAAEPAWSEPAPIGLSLDALLKALASELPVGRAAQLGKQLTGIDHRQLYQRMLALKDRN